MSRGDNGPSFPTGLAAHRRLTPGEERALGERARAGDPDARGELVRCNVRLALSLARRHAGRGVDAEDVVGEGLLGLVVAASKYDPGRGTRFATAAVPWVRAGMSRAVRRAAREGSRRRGLPGAAEADRGRLAEAPDGETPAPDAFLEWDDDRARVARLLAGLPAREREVVELRYGLGGKGAATLAEAAAAMGVSKQRVQQLQARALGRLRAHAGAFTAPS